MVVRPLNEIKSDSVNYHQIIRKHNPAGEALEIDTLHFPEDDDDELNEEVPVVHKRPPVAKKERPGTACSLKADDHKPKVKRPVLQDIKGDLIQPIPK